MSPILISPPTRSPGCWVPLNPYTEIPTEYLGRSDRNTGGWAKVEGIFSGSHELPETPSEAFSASVVRAPKLSGVLAGKSRPGMPDSWFVFSGTPEGYPTTSDIASGRPDDPGKTA